MLFKFGNFGKQSALVVGSWIFYGLWDFEFTAITLLALILALKLQN